jgi:hypothetical protein
VASLFGVYFAWIWLLLNTKSGYYVSRWRPMIEAIEGMTNTLVSLAR